MFVVSSPSVRNCSSKPSSSTNTIGGTPGVFVAFPSVGLLAVVVSGAVFTELLTSRTASACPLSIINGSGWLLQNCASVCCSRLRVLLVCLLESAIIPLILANFKNVPQIRVKSLIHTFLGYFGEAMIAEKNFSPSDSASFENVFRIRCNLPDTTCFAILLLNTTPFPIAQNTS